MGQTSTGLPYPEPTDPVAEGAAAIKALADALNRRVPYGLCTGGVNVVMTAVDNATAAVTFPAGTFTTAPAVFTDIARGGVSRLVTSRAQSITPTGFSAWCGVAETGQTLTTTAGVDWLAIRAPLGGGGNPALAAFAVADAPPDTARVTVTCQEPGCPNEGLGIELDVPDGTDPEVPAPSSYWCGACNTEAALVVGAP